MRPEDYPFEVQPLSNDDGGGYLVTFPDLPGCMSDGDTLEEALHNGLDAAESWLRTAAEFGDPVPKPGYRIGSRLFAQLPQSLAIRLSESAQEQGMDVGALATRLISEGLIEYETRRAD
jgi:antitoxin HicB